MADIEDFPPVAIEPFGVSWCLSI